MSHQRIDRTTLHGLPVGISQVISCSFYSERRLAYSANILDRRTVGGEKEKKKKKKEKKKKRPQDIAS
jgi:uncharacterized protein YqhQ